jgi:hypothetical protein
MRFDGTCECAEAIAKQLWPNAEATALRQNWMFHKMQGATWANPGRGHMLVGSAGDWIVFYAGTYKVMPWLPKGCLDDTSPLTRKIMDEWMRR